MVGMMSTFSVNRSTSVPRAPSASRLGSEFTPALEEGDILLRLTMAPSISLDEASATTTRVEKALLANFPEIETIEKRAMLPDRTGELDFSSADNEDEEDAA